MRDLEVALALIRREGRWLLQRRSPGNPVLPGLWEFPGGKAEPGESAEAACRREVREELGLEVLELRAMEPLVHTYPDRRVTLRPFQVEVEGPPTTALAWGWFRPEEMGRLPLPEANLGLIPRLH